MKWADLANLLIPIILPFINPKLAPLSGYITTGITQAEAIPGATGTQKLAAAVSLVNTGVGAVNTAAGKTVVDVTGLDNDISAGISTVVQAINLFHTAQPGTVTNTVPTPATVN